MFPEQTKTTRMAVVAGVGRRVVKLILVERDARAEDGRARILPSEQYALVMPPKTMDRNRLQYDAASATLRYAAPVEGTELIDVGVAKALGKIGREGQYEGNEVRAVEVRFADDAAAEHNADRLGFLGVASAGPSGRRVQSASFSAREDFGVKG